MKTGAGTGRGTLVLAVAIGIGWGWSGALSGPKSARTVDREKMQAQFVATTRHLQPGGSVYMVGNMDGMLENWFAKLLEALPEDRDTGEVRNVLRRTHLFLKQNGFYAGETFGISSVPQADGLHSLRLFMARSPEARELALWRGLTGGEPRRLSSLSLLPRNTVLASVSTGEPEALWSIVRRGIAEIGTQSVREGFEKALTEMAGPIGIDLDTLIASLGNECFYSIQFCEETTVTLPIDGSSFTMPRPDFLFGIAIEDDTLPDLLKRHLASVAEMGMPLVESQVEDVTLHTVHLPLPLPVPWQPTLATFSGMLLIGSSPEIVQAAQEADRDGNGVTQAPAFQQAFAGLAWDECNSISYMAPRFGAALQEYGRHSMENLQAMSHDMPPAMMALFSMFHNMQKDQPPDSSAMLTRNLADGILTEGRSTTSGGEMLATATAFPVGFIAGMAIPAFTMARHHAMEVQAGGVEDAHCINNMRNLEHAKEAYAIMKNLAADEPIFWKDIHAYLGQGLEEDPLTCPEGGQPYTCQNPEGRYANSLGDVSGNNPVVCPHVQTYPTHVYAPGH